MTTGLTANHVYTSAGTFTAQLKVTDNSGLSATKSLTITVNPAVTLATMRVADIAMSLQSGPRSAQAIAKVKVVDANGSLVNGANVSGVWSGLVSGSGSALTSNGVATLKSVNSRSKGTFVFKVTGVTLPGYSYNMALNTETADSIAY